MKSVDAFGRKWMRLLSEAARVGHRPIVSHSIWRWIKQLFNSFIDVRLPQTRVRLPPGDRPEWSDR
jgi:hypothetical protein